MNGAAVPYKETEFPKHLPQAGSQEEFLVKFATLPDEEKRIVGNQVIGIQHALKEQISSYVADEENAERLGWPVSCSFFGYQQMFTQLGVEGMVDLSMDEYGGFATQVVGRGMGGPDADQGRLRM